MIIATAGHVDHGKTSLVKNLTGVETDRLEEEQRRGLSINLGYAYWRPDSETVVGFIDVPGHRRFINNMISGISGIDLGMLVVAADDGPMPQTREHLQVMNLLGVEHYALVVTKCDRVDAQRVGQVRGSVAALLPEKTPVYEVSNITGAGIEQLKAALQEMAGTWTQRAARGHFRMSIDRAFNLQGRGLILTGTIASGAVSSGESLVLQPQRKIMRVRGLHTQDAPAVLGKAGERCALNVSGDVHKNDVQRGDWVTSESCTNTTSRFDARIQLLPDAAFPLKHLAEVKLHIGAKHLKARVMLLKSERASVSRIHPGDSSLAQLVTDRPVLCCHGDRFLLRDYGETVTLGGGTVLDPQGAKQRRSSSARVHFLTAMEHHDIDDAIRAALGIGNDERNTCTLNYDALLKARNIDRQDGPGTDIPGIARIETSSGELWLAQSRWTEMKQAVLDAVLAAHGKNPGESGFKPSLIARAALAVRDQHFFKPAIVALLKSDSLVIRDGLLVAKDHETSVSGEPHEWLAIAACLQKRGKQIPTLTQLEQECRIDMKELLYVIGKAQREEKIVKINAKRYAQSSVLNEFAQAALDVTADETALTVINYRDYLGCGRNIAVDVLEYFDGIRFTRRVGEARIILRRALPTKFFNA